MIGLFKAICSYQKEKDTAFSTFAVLCIRRQIYTTVTASNRKKHGPLNNYISIFGNYEENGEIKLDEVWKTLMKIQKNCCSEKRRSEIIII